VICEFVSVSQKCNFESISLVSFILWLCILPPPETSVALWHTTARWTSSPLYNTKQIPSPKLLKKVMWHFQSCLASDHVTHIYFICCILFWSFIPDDQTVRCLTHCGRVTQICVFTLLLCQTDDANLRF